MIRSLRIVLCCQQDLQAHPLPAYRFWAEYFRHGLAEAGHTVLECPDCDWAKGLLPLSVEERRSWQTETWTRHDDWLRRELANRPVDLFLGYLFPLQIDPAAIRAIRDQGVPCVNFFCDNVREFLRVPAEFAAFDLHWVPEYKAGALYRRARLPFLTAPMPCWVPPQWRTPNVVEKFAPTFIGTRDGQREALFAAAIERGLEVELRGVGWRAADPPPTLPTPPPSRDQRERIARQKAFVRQHGWLALARKTANSWFPRPPPRLDFTAYARPAPRDDAYWEILRNSRVCLGVNRYPSFRHPWHRPDTYSRLRDLEAPMVGACYLTEWTEGLDGLYELGSEIETYRDATELAEKTRALSFDAARRASLRERGQRRALRDHTIGQTINRIAGRLGVAGPH